MAKCVECGKPVGFFGRVCQDCERRKREAQAAEAAERQRRENELVRRLASERANSIRERVASGNRVFLYETVYIPVNSIIDNQEVCAFFDIDRLRELGLRGWKVVQIVPRTMGMSLINKNLVGGISTGIDAYAGGIGGTVIGVHVILQLEVDSTQPPDMAALLAFAGSHASIDFGNSDNVTSRT